MNPGVYGPLDSATNLYTGLPINKQRVSTNNGVVLILDRTNGDILQTWSTFDKLIAPSYTCLRRLTYPHPRPQQRCRSRGCDSGRRCGGGGRAAAPPGGMA